MRKLLLLSTVALLPCAVASNASAAPIYTYHYTGQPFDYFAAGIEAPLFTNANHIRFAFSTSAPIAADTTYYLIALTGTQAPNPTLLSWWVSDGTNSFSSQTGWGYLYGDEEVRTDANGNIVSWDFLAYQVGGQLVPNAPPDQLGVDILSCGPAICMSAGGYTGQYAGDYDQINPPDGSTYLYSGDATTPGSWTETVSADLVPEPSTLAILSVGLLGLATLRRQRH